MCHKNTPPALEIVPGIFNLGILVVGFLIKYDLGECATEKKQWVTLLGTRRIRTVVTPYLNQGSTHSDNLLMGVKNVDTGCPNKSTHVGEYTSDVLGVMFIKGHSKQRITRNMLTTYSM